MLEYPVNPKAISMLVKMRQFFMGDDGTAANKVAGSGKYMVSDLLADTIAAINHTEQQCIKALEELEMECSKNREYCALLEGHHPDELTGAQKDEIATLVSKWDDDEDESE